MEIHNTEGQTNCKACEAKCPVCGYYCQGNGGVGCIDKARMIHTCGQSAKDAPNFPIKSKPTNNARILTVLLSKHGQDKICDSLKVLGWALDKAVAEEREQELDIISERLRLLKEKELPKACEDYSGDMDERIHFDDGYTEAISDILQTIKSLRKE